MAAAFASIVDVITVVDLCDAETLASESLAALIETNEQMMAIAIPVKIKAKRTRLDFDDAVLLMSVSIVFELWCK